MIYPKKDLYGYVETNNGAIKVKILSYDEDKYVTVLLPDGTVDDFKSGYIFTSVEKKEEYDKYIDEDLNTRMYKNYPKNAHFNLYKECLSHKDYSQYKKSLRKRKVTYDVFDKENIRHTFKFLKKALNFFENLPEDTPNKPLFMSRSVSLGSGFSYSPLLEYSKKQGLLYYAGRKRKDDLTLKARHIGKCFSYKDLKK